MMNESEAKTVLLLLNEQIEKLEQKKDFMSAHDLGLLTKLKKNLLHNFPNL